MADPASVDKVEAMYIKQIDFLEKQMAQIRQDHELDRKFDRDEYHDRAKKLLSDQQERKEELLAQNDGMLGAIGRLHSENQTLRQQLGEAQVRVNRFEEEHSRMANEAQAQSEMAHRLADEKVCRMNEEATREIKSLKKQIEELKTKAKKKA